MKHIKLFQAEHGLVADGIIGPNTLRKMKSVWNINNEQLGNFLGETHHESGGFERDTENLNYSTAGLLDTFERYFKNQAQAAPYARKPEKIANKVYANRMGNGNEASGDGFKFRGRGAIQTTGKDNYEMLSVFVGEDLIANPELAATKYYWETGLFYFKVNKLWETAKRVDTASITKLAKAINGGTNGLADRIARTNYYYSKTKNL